MHLEVSGERTVTAADVMVPSTVEIVNPDLHIATLDNDNARLEMELVVETGRGYVPADSKEDQPIGVIPIDAIYKPVQKVKYTVKHMRLRTFVPDPRTSTVGGDLEGDHEMED